ncbi:MAG: bifunctional hexulose-6-phosphate synthase/ribonuclease regulator [Dehalococcoidales bacterium]|jgi:3-hexulose-6-phosphate synthase/6-phospho-3-hexuloisomerase|nr:bifunctional hexulose-6-phosphate synthase/ribonuclease regulator [Dehalococcoidales bacterium]
MAKTTRKQTVTELPPVQVALDLLDLPRAIQIAKEAVKGILSENGGDITKAWVEAGTPLIKSEGMNAIRELRAAFPGQVICADMKVMDAGATEVEMAAKAGANVVFILGCAPDSCISEAVLAGKKYGVKVAADLISVKDPPARAVELEKMGIDIINIHVGLDQQVLGIQPVDLVKTIKKAITGKAQISAAGGINSETAVKAWEAGADIIIAGGSLYKAKSPEESAAKIVKSLKTGKPVETNEFKKFDKDHLVEAFMKVSTSNISDAMHRTGELRGLKPVWTGAPGELKFAGPAVTVRTYNGDWSAPVQAIDQAKPGDVLVIDACEGEVAVWGELATNSCVSQGVVGVVIDGAVRDIDDIKKMKFPLFAKHFTPTAGEPKGFGEINVAIEVCHRKVEPGDWIIGDESGVVVVPRDSAMEMANRAIDVLEKENRIREEIQRGSTLAKTQYLSKWDIRK